MVIDAIIELPMVISPIIGELMVTRGTMEGLMVTGGIVGKGKETSIMWCSHIAVTTEDEATRRKAQEEWEKERKAWEARRNAREEEGKEDDKITILTTL
ncbi:hypothetical protein Acr_13g0008150 [Actinidia rufa]|uniref:Uncharacterized protein n=1 Tax=Actinidia rufa TaxID=165716 RepID=A0A7J0FL34_9ERIC|nr:hypothetical protein Acr_13g0008150 [Actinidia rufa]